MNRTGLLLVTTETSTPLAEQEAQGNNSLDVSQRGAVIGEVIPIVFARRVGSVGGVLISPAATEARFENSLTNEVTAYYHLVLGEGPMDSLQVRDVFQRSCRVGSFSQTYDRRAGPWEPGNFIVPRDGYTTPEAPSYCGTGGTYTGLSTLSFQATYPDGVDQWNRQVHCFVRGGIYVTRLLDGVTGPSNNVADLLRYLLRSSSRVPDAQVDAAVSFLAAATFTNVNGFWFNGSVDTSTNLRDWVNNTLKYFLLRLTRVGGKETLKPLLPTNADGTIKTTAVDWEFAFTEEHIVPGSFAIDYASLADRKPFAVLVLWRQQDDLGIPLIRTVEVRYAGTADDGPFEQHDLSAFCALENHAVKVGTYILSRRNHIKHRLSIAVRPDAYNSTLAPGDRVRVRLERTPSTGAASAHDYLYEVNRIGKNISGQVQLDLTHFPVDDTFASVVAKEVASAVGAGFVLPTGLSGITCDVNSSGDTSIPIDTSLDPSEWDIPIDGSFDVGTIGTDGFFDIGVIEIEETELDDMPQSSIDDLELGGIGGLGGLGDFGGIGTIDGIGTDASEGNPSDGLDGQIETPPLTIGVEPEGALPGLPLTTEGTICAGGTYEWLRDGVPIAGATSSSYTPGADDIGANVTSKVTCPDGSTTTSNPISVAAQPQFRFDQPISATVNYTLSFKGVDTVFCASPSPSIQPYDSTGSGARSVTNVTRIQPVCFITQPPNAGVIGYKSPAYRYTVSCGLSPVTWIDGNFGILSINGDTLTNTAFLGGGSNYSQSVVASVATRTLTIDSIILTANAPGLGVIGDNVWRAGLGWYADVSYIERNYGDYEIDGVLQPFNPFGPPTTP